VTRPIEAERSTEMPISETEIELLAQAMIQRHGTDAAKTAVARLNQMIDRGDWEGRDRWACVVRAIHEGQGASPAYAPRDRVNAAMSHLV
jgi:hypothetical protein